MQIEKRLDKIHLSEIESVWNRILETTINKIVVGIEVISDLVIRTSIPPRGIPNSFAPPLDFTVSSISVTTLVLVTFANVFTGILAGFFCALYFLEVNLFVTSGNAIRGVIRDSTKPVANESMTSEMRKKSRQLIEGLIALGWLPQAVSTMSTCTFRIQDARWNVDRSVPRAVAVQLLREPEFKIQNSLFENVGIWGRYVFLAYRTPAPAPAPDPPVSTNNNRKLLFYFALCCRTLTVIKGYIQSQLIGRVAACVFITGF